MFITPIFDFSPVLSGFQEYKFFINRINFYKFNRALVLKTNAGFARKSSKNFEKPAVIKINVECRSLALILLITYEYPVV